MRQRGRKTAAVIPFAVLDGTPARLEPPAHLTKSERAQFLAIVDGSAPGHFMPSDAPLLAAYVTAITLSRRTARDPDKLGQWEAATKMMATLATKLRVSPHTRRDPKTVARAAAVMRTGTAPWER